MPDRGNSLEFSEEPHGPDERLRQAEAASGIGTFELDLESGHWNWGPQIAALFGLDAEDGKHAVATWEKLIFVDDVPKIHAAFAEAKRSGASHVEFRVRHPDGSLHWLAAKGRTLPNRPTAFRGAIFEITERKVLEARLLALNETLEARVAQVREEARTLEVLNRTGIAVAAELDLERLVQMVTDAGVELSHAEFGAFFYNVTKADGEAYTLYTLSGAPRSAFEKFPMPRNTAIFEPTFRGRGPVRSDDILKDSRYGKSAPYHGMPEGHLPVRSYLAVPVISRSGEVVGGLFFGHARPGVFASRAEQILTALAAQAAVAIDNSRLHHTSQMEIEARRQAERDLQALNYTLEQRAEERARHLAASLGKLEETEQRFRLLVEGVQDYAIYMLDPDGHVVNWNPGAERIKGYSSAEIIGRHFRQFYTPEDQTDDVPLKALATARRTGKFETENWRVRKDGTRFWASVLINAIKDNNGELLGFAKITRDLTERRAADERARQAQKMEGIGQLTGGVAHDFNNLLTIIIGNVDTLHRALHSDAVDIARLRRLAGNIMQGARRAESLTQRLLAFSRQQPLDPKPIDVGRLVTGMSDLLRRTLGEQVTVETVLSGGVWRALADPNQLELAILNLAVNARDAMPTGGKLTIETTNVHLDDQYAATQIEVIPGQYVLLAVTDTGTGMPEDVKARAFDPFFTTKEIGHGTGLGLSQVYGFVKQSRGHVRIYSEPGFGTTIKIYLPRVVAQIEEIETPSVVAIARGSSAETILVVEDDEGVRSYGCETLRELGYRVLEAGSGRAGLEMLAKHPEVRLLFTDIGLPGGMNGRQLAEEARRHKPNLRVLFTTAYARNAIIHDGRLDPGVALLSKPYTQSALASKVRDILDAGHSPARILLVEDEVLIQMLAIEYLEEAGFRVDAAGSAAEAVNKLALIPGGVDAAIVDMGLPDRKGDVLIRELRTLHPMLPVVIATGHGADTLRAFEGQPSFAFVQKPYTAAGLIGALRSLHVAPNPGTNGPRTPSSLS
jgi:PAS domain S-box-containing protein